MISAMKLDYDLKLGVEQTKTEPHSSFAAWRFGCKVTVIDFGHPEVSPPNLLCIH
jgi:hypothetical protein